MSEAVIRLSNLSKTMDEAWETMDFKKKDAIQITSFSQKYKTPNGDEQASDYKELLEITKRSGIYNGIELHALTV